MEVQTRMRENISHCMSEATLGGHDLRPWALVGEGGLYVYQAVCRRCGKSTYATNRMIVSILDEVCPGSRYKNGRAAS